MKTIRLASLTALISSVVLLDNGDAWAGSPETPQEEEMAARLRSIADDPELMADTAEFETSQATMTKKKSVATEIPSEVSAEPSHKKVLRRTLGNTKPLPKRQRR